MFYSATSSVSLGREIARFGRNWWESLRLFVFIGIICLVAVTASQQREVVLSAALAFVILVVAMVAYYTINKREIVVYEGGIGYRTRDGEKTWTWDQFTHMDGTRHTQSVNGIPMAKWGANNFYAGQEKAFSVQANTAMPDRIVQLMLAKIAQNYIPKLMNDIKSGRAVTLGGYPLDREGLQTRKEKILWSDIKQIDVRGNTIKLERQTDRRKINLGSLNNGSSFALLGVLDAMTNSEQLKQVADDNMTGRHYLLGMPKAGLRVVVLFVVVLLVGLGGVFGVQAYQATQANKAYQYLVSTYGSDALTLCDIKDKGKLSAVNGIKVVVIDVQNRRVYDDYQKLLDPQLVATNRDEATLAICVRPSYERYETCEYGDADASAPTFTIERYLTAHDLTVIDVKGGKRVLTDALYGSDPAECPDSAKSSTRDIYGTAPSSDDFVKWVSEYVSKVD
ncbi:MAG: hypothetical protein KF726_01465 [Anaerolineae bacterium]|nr:hypothetical protein [Anaerolineae bacterium]